MKRAILIFAVVVPGVVSAQVSPANPALERNAAIESGDAFAIRPPDESSPFFMDRENAKFAQSQEGLDRASAEGVSTYPRVKDSTNSATAMIGRFFGDMFASVKIGSLKGDPTTEDLVVEPSEFSLESRRELNTTYTVKNNTKKLMRLDFPTSQRLDIVTTDGSGKVIDKWSDDRAFTPQEGIIIINPKERIEYNETVPTRDMKTGQSYNIQSDVSGYPEYSVTRTVTPTP